MVSDPVIARAILARCAARAPKTVCPSEVARDLAADWRPLMAAVRRVAGALADEGRIAITQRGAPATADARGPIRLAQAGGASRPAKR